MHAMTPVVGCVRNQTAVLVRHAGFSSVLAFIFAACQSQSPVVHLDIATTTSVEQSGLLSTLLPLFERDSTLDVRVHAVGSGLALQMFARNDVDLVISHAPEAEARFLKEHPDYVYRKLAYNWFVIVGPPTDPAGIRSAADAVDAFRRIVDSKSAFVSRGDGSGTHEREETLWTTAGRRPTVIVSGRGMSQALRHANEVVGYTLSDEATYMQLRSILGLQVLYRDGQLLRNTYSVLYAPNHSHATTFGRWLIDGPGRNHVSRHRIAGQQVFFPWPSGCPRSAPADTPCAQLAQ